MYNLRRPGIGPEMQRSPTIDGVRGLAVLLVLAFHTLGTFSPPSLHPLLWPLAGGTLGVDIFFVLSGFLLVRSWEASRSLKTFWWRRARRILPAYWVSLAVLVPLQAPHLLHDMKSLALFASMQTFLQPRLPWAVNAAYWSLTPEVHFYFLLPALYALGERLGTRRTLVVVFALSLLWRAFSTSHYHFPADLLPGRIDQFVAGMAAATAGSRMPALATRRAALLAAGALAVVVPVYGWMFWRTGGDPPHLVEALVHPLLGALIAIGFVRLGHVGHVRVLAARPLAALGAVSYSVYLWHLPLLVIVRRFGKDGWVLVAAVGAALCAGVVSYLVVERPFLRTRRRADDAPPAPPAPVEALSGG
jgi:peptidoglycan/LPS O-acetylase OafA/YrhL